MRLANKIMSIIFLVLVVGLFVVSIVLFEDGIKCEMGEGVYTSSGKLVACLICENVSVEPVYYSNQWKAGIVIGFFMMLAGVGWVVTSYY